MHENPSTIPIKSIEAVFKVFKKNYVLVPLEIFGNDPYKTLISTVMSARTKDETTLLASNRLFQKALNFDQLSNLSIDSIETLIYPVGFYKTKAKNLKHLSEKIINEFDREVPKTLERLLALPGVGLKTANLVLNRAYDIPAIAVDTHVHRITNLLGWVTTNNPKDTLTQLEKRLPQKYWSDMNKLFVSIGRQYTTRKSLEEFLKDNKLID